MSMPSQQLGKRRSRTPSPAVAGPLRRKSGSPSVSDALVRGALPVPRVPLVYSLYISMTDRRLISAGKAHFVGLQNYIYMFTQDAFFYKSLLITMKWILMSTPLFLSSGC